MNSKATIHANDSSHEIINFYLNLIMQCINYTHISCISENLAKFGPIHWMVKEAIRPTTNWKVNVDNLFLMILY